MKGILCALVLTCVASAASAWEYVPIEQGRSYNAYRGPYWGGYYPRPMGYVRPVYPASPSYSGSMTPISDRYRMRYHEMYNSRTGETWSGFSF